MVETIASDRLGIDSTAVMLFIESKAIFPKLKTLLTIIYFLVNLCFPYIISSW